ncbi:MAG: hydantoinase B/oxoprolinase family protein [Pseudomonadota bacterium]
MGTNTIDLQIMWNRLIAVVEEQATTLIRTAFSTSVREAGDLSAGLFDSRARMMAQAVTGTPGHVNAMAESVAHFVREIGEENIFEGDVYLTNDPWMGTGHLHDVTAVSPTFRQGKLVGYFACTAHVVDIGGRGFGPDGNEIYEEGLQIPIMKFAERGIVSRGLIKIIRTNVREPDQVVGDIYSLAACNEAGDRRLQDMMDEFKVDELDTLSDFIFDASYKATIERISKLPNGRFENTMTVDGYDTPIDMRIAITIDRGSLKADFNGTSKPSNFGINVPMVYTRAYACYALKCAIAPDVPNNAGSLVPFQITAPDNCILNAHRPAPVSIRHVLGHLIPDVTLGALHKCLPATVPAEGASSLWNIQISARSSDPSHVRPPAEMLIFNSGGTGARPNCDGLSATAFPSGVKSMSAEATEHVGPIIIWRKELREGSGGAGRCRGGLGQTIEIAPREGYDIYINAMFERIVNPPRGRDGGDNGSAGSVSLGDGSTLQGKGRQKIPDGSRIVLQLPGGGGYGEPSERSRESIVRDLEAGYISEEQAYSDYKLDVVLNTPT